MFKISNLLDLCPLLARSSLCCPVSAIGPCCISYMPVFAIASHIIGAEMCVVNVTCEFLIFKLYKCYEFMSFPRDGKCEVTCAD